jgi:hypothetical protein
LADVDATEIELVDPRIQLVGIGIVDLAQPPAAHDRFADLDVES